MKKILIVFILMILGCSQIGSIAALQGAIAASEVAIATLETTGNVSPQTANEVISYLQIASNDITNVSTILVGNEPSVQKALEISVAFNNLPILIGETGVYIVGVQTAIKAFLAFYPVNIASNAKAIGKVSPLTLDQVKELNYIKVRAKALSLELARLKR